MVDTLQKGAVQPAELAQVVKALLGVVRTVRSQLEDYVKEAGKVIKIDVESEVSKIAQKLQKEMDKMRGMMPEMPDLSILEADIEELKAKDIPTKNAIIEAVEKDIPQLGLPIRDSLELLQGNERLERKAIKGIDELEKTLNAKIDAVPRGGGGGGGLMRGATKYYKLTPDGTTKIFNVPKSVTSIIFMSDFPSVLFENNGFTLNASRTQVTLTVTDAPSTSSQLVYSYSPMFGF